MYDPADPFKPAYDEYLQVLVDRSDALPQTGTLIRAVDLDRNFQRHVAGILAREFSVSKRVLASLVVLVYISAELVEPTGRKIRIPGTKKPLTPSAVYQKLKGVPLASQEKCKTDSTPRSPEDLASSASNQGSIGDSLVKRQR